MPKKIPKLVMFGPGLESETSGIVRKMLEGESELFKTTGMFPGQFEGRGIYHLGEYIYLTAIQRGKCAI